VEDGVTVGETIADARGAAGLSVGEVSERTRIRETVIRSIEQDDFDTLGGDLYVRGYLRAIAGVVGVDPQPLIREFDVARSAGLGGWPAIGGTPEAAVAETASAAEASGTREAADTDGGVVVGDALIAGEPAEAADADEPAVAEEGGGIAGPAMTSPLAADETPAAGDQPTLLDQLMLLDQPAVADQFPTRVDQPAIFDRPIIEDYPTLADQPAIMDEPTVVDPWGSQSWNHVPWDSATLASDDYQPFWADDAVSDADPAPVAQAAFAEPTVAIAAADRVTSGRRYGPAGSGPLPKKPRGRSRVRGWRWATVISILVVVVLGVVGVASGQIVAKLRHINAAPSATATVAPPVVVQTTAATPSPTPTPTPTPASTPVPVPVPIRQLAVLSAVAYGPAGAADGDHPDRAWNVIARYPAQPWQTDWYATARFGALKPGTGLLLDMGRRVTITSLRIRLGSAGGASLQIRVGDEPALSMMPVRASAQDASGPMTSHLVRPARARYVIIWFTKLPPVAVGQYRVSVYSVTVSGRP
jgi:hypothetical protein